MQLSTHLPYSQEALASFLAGYHQTIWPFQIVSVILIVLMIAALYRPFQYSGRMIFCILGLFWLWIGEVFYLRSFSSMSFLAPGIGIVAFVQAGLLFFFAGTYKGLLIADSKRLIGRTGIFCIILSLLVMPGAISLIEGQWESWRLAGATPVATALFTIGILLLARVGKNIQTGLLIIPCAHLLASGIEAILLV